MPLPTHVDLAHYYHVSDYHVALWLDCSFDRDGRRSYCCTGRDVLASSSVTIVVEEDAAPPTATRN